MAGWEGCGAAPSGPLPWPERSLRGEVYPHATAGKASRFIGMQDITIGTSDFDVKRKRVVKFLNQGDKVKCTMRFRGREMAHPELGRDILKRLYEEVSDYGEIETMPKLEGRNMTMVLVPARNGPIDDFEPEDDITDED